MLRYSFLNLQDIGIGKVSTANVVIIEVSAVQKSINTLAETSEWFAEQSGGTFQHLFH